MLGNFGSGEREGFFVFLRTNNERFHYQESVMVGMRRKFRTKNGRLLFLLLPRLPSQDGGERD